MMKVNETDQQDQVDEEKNLGVQRDETKPTLTLEAALAELQTLFPGCGVLIDVDLWANIRCDQGGEVNGSHAWITVSANQDGVMDADFSGESLADVMETVREHAPNVAFVQVTSDVSGTTTGID